jgi:hypothetical protein
MAKIKRRGDKNWLVKAAIKRKNRGEKGEKENLPAQIPDLAVFRIRRKVKGYR